MLPVSVSGVRPAASSTGMLSPRRVHQTADRIGGTDLTWTMRGGAAQVREPCAIAMATFRAGTVTKARTFWSLPALREAIFDDRDAKSVPALAKHIRSMPAVRPAGDIGIRRIISWGVSVTG